MANKTVDWQAVSQKLRGVAQEEQSRASKIENFTPEGLPPIKLRPINEVGDEHQKARSFKSMATLAALVFVVWYLGSSLVSCMSGKAQTTVSAAAVSNATLAPSVVVTAVPVSGDIFAQAMQTPGAFNYGQSAVMAKPPAASPAPLTVRCYATLDEAGVYSDTQIYKGGLFLAEQYTRVKGGMIFNRKFGWYYVSSFGCASGLDDLEVEFVEPKPTVAKPVVRVAPTRSVAVPPLALVATFVPLATPMANGIISFSALNCDYVTWLAWNVRAVYLQAGSDRHGVAGDNGGQPVVTSVCPYTGTLTLQAVGQDGLTYSRSLSVQ